METLDFERRLRASFKETLRASGEFFMDGGDVRKTLVRLAERLGAEGIPYALVGGMALGKHGYVRMTDDVDVLVAAEGLRRFVERCVGRGYVPTHAGATRSFRDAETRVRIEFLVTGEFPGDGKPKAVAFPAPEGASVETDGIRVLTLPRLVELKLASGTTAPDRLRDLADVQELIRAEDLTEDFAEQIDLSVRPKFLELLGALKAARRE